MRGCTDWHPHLRRFRSCDLGPSNHCFTASAEQYLDFFFSSLLTSFCDTSVYRRRLSIFWPDSDHLFSGRFVFSFGETPQVVSVSDVMKTEFIISLKTR